MNIIECCRIKKSYAPGKKTGRPFGLDIEDLKIEEGLIHVLLGPNGAGKSTLIKLMLDIIRADEGEIFINGFRSANPASRGCVGFLPEDFSFPQDYKFSEVLYYFGLLKENDGRKLKEGCSQILNDLEISAYTNKKVSSLSKGMLQSLALVHALSARSRLLILDEPFDGLDPLRKRKTIEYIKELNTKMACTVLITTHLLSDVEKYADRIMLIKNGRIISIKDMEEIMRNNYAIEDYYFSFFGKEIKDEAEYAE